MKVFLAGSTGAIGKRLLPKLIARGHQVTALVRNAEKAEEAKRSGATAVIADAFDRGALTTAVIDAAPELVMHQLTALSGGVGNFRKFDAQFAVTNRLRTEVTDTLLSAARAAGARRFIAQSFCGWPFARVGGPVKTEEDPLDSAPPSSFQKTLAAIRYLEYAVQNADDIEAFVLRYGMFYGPGTGIERGAPIVEMVRKRRLPIVGEGTGIWSFIHIDDAAEAAIAAMSRGTPGIYNVVDDEPAPVATWLPHMAQVLGAKPPRRVPVWLAKFMIGEGGVSMMTEIRGASNAKVKREMSWQPVHASWRRGFEAVLGSSEES